MPRKTLAEIQAETAAAAVELVENHGPRTFDKLKELAEEMKSRQPLVFTMPEHGTAPDGWEHCVSCPESGKWGAGVDPTDLDSWTRQHARAVSEDGRALWVVHRLLPVERERVDLSSVEKVTETREVEGIRLPYRFERGMEYDGGALVVSVQEGEVFVSLHELVAVALQNPLAYLAGDSLYLDTRWADYALEQAGLAVREKDGGVHGTPVLKELLARLEGGS